VVASAEELQFDGATLKHDGENVSLTYNKIRIATPGSPNHCWQNGFETRYRGFLEAIRKQAVVSVNNLCAASIGEDKGLLALLFRREFRNQLTTDDCRFIDDHVLWTARLDDERIEYGDKEIDLLNFVEAHRDQFVIKPANEGRGFGVVIGRHCDQETWARVCRPESGLPFVVQKYAEPAMLPVLLTTKDSLWSNGRSSPNKGLGGDSLQHRDMYLTVAIGIIAGQYAGLFSRVSPDPVTNVGRSGVVQAALIAQ
jgi:hypothetical protein